MDFFSVLALLGGLAMFLFGMHLMSDGLSKLSGSKMEKILEKLTSNKLRYYEIITGGWYYFWC